MKTIHCHCGESFESDFPNDIDLDRHPDLFDDILSGRFMNLICPHCGQELKPEFPVRIIQGSRNLDLFYIPELERSKMLMGKLPYSLPEVNRVVIGYPELIEKITIFELDLDDRIIEILKYYLLKPALEIADDEKEIRILFKDRTQNELVFHLEGIRDEEIGVTKLPVDTYNKALLNLEETINKEPFSILLTPPYVSLNKIYQEE